MEASAVGVGHQLKVQVLSRSPSQRNFSNSTIVMMRACVLYHNALNFCLGTKFNIFKLCLTHPEAPQFATSSETDESFSHCHSSSSVLFARQKRYHSSPGIQSTFQYDVVRISHICMWRVNHTPGQNGTCRSPRCYSSRLSPCLPYPRSQLREFELPRVHCLMNS